MVSGATSISVAMARLGGQLVRVSTPANSNVRPDLVVGDSVQLYLDGTGEGGPAAVQVLLNSGVSWRLIFAGGASQTSVDLTDGKFGGTVLTSQGWAEAGPRYLIDAPAGASSLNVTG